MKAVWFGNVVLWNSKHCSTVNLEITYSTIGRKWNSSVRKVGLETTVTHARRVGLVRTATHALPGDCHQTAAPADSDSAQRVTALYVSRMDTGKEVIAPIILMFI